jgi:hypothetical protein
MGTGKGEADSAPGQGHRREHVQGRGEPREKDWPGQRPADLHENPPEHLHDYPHEREHSHEQTSPREHRREPAHPHYISLKLRDLNQLFNSMDPSPFIEKDLDDDAEEFIVSWAQEYSADTPIRLRIHLDQWPSEDPKELVKTAVHNHFAHRAQIADLEFKRLMKQGRTSLLIGLVFLSACLISSRLLLGRDVGTWAAIVRESLTIAGWVAMWRPMQIYLYDWWPVRRRGRVFRKLSHMPVEVTGTPSARG